MNIAVKITNALTFTFIEYTLDLHDKSTFEDICAYHSGLEKMHPNSHVNFTWPSTIPNEKNFICGMPVNMRIDGELMDFEDYFAKWYSKTNFAADDSQTANTLIDEFLNSEFSN